MGVPGAEGDALDGRGMTINFNPDSSWNDGGILMDVEREPIAYGDNGFNRVTYYGVQCRHGEWAKREYSAFEPEWDVYVCARGCGAALRIRTVR